MRKLAFLLIVVALLAMRGSGRGGFPGKVNWEKVIAYSFIDPMDPKIHNIRPGDTMEIVPGSKIVLCADDKHPKTELRAEQVNELLSILDDPQTYSDGEPACYSPRTIFYFLDKEGKAVAWCEVCFECGQAKFFPENRIAHYGSMRTEAQERLENFCRKAGITLIKPGEWPNSY